MNLPKGYSNLCILASYFHESRSSTIKRAQAGEFRTARQYRKAKLEVWIIETEEMLEIMHQHKQDVPSLRGYIRLEFLPEVMGVEVKDAKQKLKENLASLFELFPGELDQDSCSAWVEED